MLRLHVCGTQLASQPDHPPLPPRPYILKDLLCCAGRHISPTLALIARLSQLTSTSQLLPPQNPTSNPPCLDESDPDTPPRRTGYTLSSRNMETRPGLQTSTPRGRIPRRFQLQRILLTIAELSKRPHEPNTKQRRRSWRKPRLLLTLLQPRRRPRALLVILSITTPAHRTSTLQTSTLPLPRRCIATSTLSQGPQHLTPQRSRASL